jgi:membrane peptidoglycan carboxypeptidase
VIGQAQRGGLAQRAVAPGSVLKPFGVVAALEAGIPRDHAFADGDMASILERSSNVGALQITTAAGRPALDDVLGRVGLPAPASLSLERLTLGEVLVTPLQVASAWTHLSGRGAISPQIAAATREMLVGAVSGEQATGRQAAVPSVQVAGKTGTAPLVGADGAVVPGRYLASFVGLVPADAPQLVILVSVAGPRGQEVWGGVVAAPAFRRIVEAL